MREREMRERVERFFQTRLRSMLLPATLGLGLAVGACNSDPLTVDDGGEPAVNKDSGSVEAKYMAPIPDAGRDLPAITPVYMAQISDANTALQDSGLAVRYMAQQPDAAPDADRMVALYMAQLPLPRS